MNEFVTASDLPTSPSREVELEDHIRQQDLIIDKLNTALESRPKESSISGGFKPGEKQALLEVLSNLQEEIKKLKKEITANSEAIIEIREYFPKLIAEDRKRLAVLEHPEKEPGKPDIERVQKLIHYMNGRPDQKASFETLRGYLGLSAERFNAVLFAARKLAPRRFEIKKDAKDKRKRWLIDKR